MVQVGKLWRFVPSGIRNKIDPYSHDIFSLVREASREIPPGQRVLDAGAGECSYRDLFPKHDYVPVDLAIGDMDWDYSGLDLICDLEALPFRSNPFQAVICTQVLEHVREPELVLKEFFRVLGTDGMLYLSAPQGWGVHQPPHDYFRFTEYGLRYLLEKAGFEVTSILPSGGYYRYLANRFTVFPKTLFWQIEKTLLRVALVPLEILAYLFFVLLAPLALNAIDFLDKKRNYTLNYLVRARKP